MFNLEDEVAAKLGNNFKQTLHVGGYPGTYDSVF